MIFVLRLITERKANISGEIMSGFRKDSKARKVSDTVRDLTSKYRFIRKLKT